VKRFVAIVLTVLLMGLLLWAGARRKESPAPGGDVSKTVGGVDPTSKAHPAEARVRGLMESARRGDVAAYLDAFAGELRLRLDREVAERGRAAFAGDLASASRSRKSHAVFSAEPEGSSAALVTVEAVYPDRNERQTYRVEKTGDAWLVTAVETVRSIQPKAKYGSLATFDAPEGVPVQETAVPAEPGGETDPTAGQVPR
jgi:hypothetical protein